MSGKPKILIVDDAASLRAVLRTFFTNEGYLVIGELAHGSSVVESIGRLNPDVVCLDYNLPGSNGLDLLKQIVVTHPDTSVVMITGDANPTLEADAAEAGIAGFIRKPFTPEQISREIHMVIHTRALLRQQGAAATPAHEASRATAVVADDSAAMRLLLVSILSQAGIRVQEAVSDGKQAVAAVARHKPDLVCLDMDMPVMNGLDALAQIRSSEATAKVLMITGRMSRETIQAAGQRGASGYILKPFDPAKVTEAVGKLLGFQA